MYDARLGTDWDSLDREEIIARAFALGVAAACGEPDRAEFERLLGELDSAYDRSIVELAYEEGRTKASALRRGSESDDEVWEALVGDGAAADDDRTAGAESGFDPHPALSRLGLLDRPNDEVDAIRLPSLLDGQGPKRKDRNR